MGKGIFQVFVEVDFEMNELSFEDFCEVREWFLDMRVGLGVGL